MVDRNVSKGSPEVRILEDGRGLEHQASCIACRGCGCPIWIAVDNDELVWESGEHRSHKCSNRSCDCHLDPLKGEDEEDEAVKPSNSPVRTKEVRPVSAAPKADRMQQFYQRSQPQVSGPQVVDESVLQPFPTNNPYLKRLFNHKLYGRVPQGCRRLLDELLTAHPGEKFLTAMRVQHGRFESGFLVVTTHFMRYIKSGRLITLLTKDEMWSLEYGIEDEGSLGAGVIRTVTGHQFQIRSWKARDFFEFHRLAQLAMKWDLEQEDSQRQALHDAAAATTVTGGQSQAQGLAAELAQLAELRAAGLLSEEEFAAAKRKLLR